MACRALVVNRARMLPCGLTHRCGLQGLSHVLVQGLVLPWVTWLAMVLCLCIRGISCLRDYPGTA
jgi:hypothetical protein